MAATYYYNGKIVRKNKIPKGAKHLWTEFRHNIYYGDDAHKRQQDKNNSEAFKRMRESREDLDRRHG